MSYVTEHLFKELREARIRKGLSQRELSAISGVPQGHISKIESGNVDIRVSSLVELCRTIDLELFLAPKAIIPAVKSIVRIYKHPADSDLQKPAYSLDDMDD